MHFAFVILSLRDFVHLSNGNCRKEFELNTSLECDYFECAPAGNTEEVASSILKMNKFLLFSIDLLDFQFPLTLLCSPTALKLFMSSFETHSNTNLRADFSVSQRLDHHVCA